MDDITLFIKLVKREYPELRFGKGIGTSSPPTVAVFSRDPEVERYCRQVRNFLGGSRVLHVIYLPERTFPDPKPEKLSLYDEFISKIVGYFSYFNFFEFLRRKNPQK